MGKYDEVLTLGITVLGLIVINEFIKNLKEQPDPRFSAAYPATVGKECGDSIS
jgi:hypothetical protein